MRIVEKEIALEIPRGHHQHVMIAQLPARLEIGEVGFRVSDPEEQWAQVRSVLELVAAGEGNLKKLHFLLFPESILPVAFLDDALTLIAAKFRENTVTVFGVEHLRLSDYRCLLERWAEDNAEALASVRADLDAGKVGDIPVNWCVIAIKESSGRLRVFLEAKSHPFFGEETVDPFHDLYRGKIFPLFRCRPTCFNFMTLICLDYIYRDEGCFCHLKAPWFPRIAGLEGEGLSKGVAGSCDRAVPISSGRAFRGHHRLLPGPDGSFPGLPACPAAA